MDLSELSSKVQKWLTVGYLAFDNLADEHYVVAGDTGFEQTADIPRQGALDLRHPMRTGKLMADVDIAVRYGGSELLGDIHLITRQNVD